MDISDFDSPNVPAGKAFLEAELEPILIDKAPVPLPEDFKEGFVKYYPYLVIIGVIFGVLGILAAFPLIAIAAAVGGFGVIQGGVGLLLLFASTVLGVLALPGLFKQQRSGWVFSYYGQLIGILGNLISLNIIGIIICVLWFYILFQVKNRYL